MLDRKNILGLLMTAAMLCLTGLPVCAQQRPIITSPKIQMLPQAWWLDFTVFRIPQGVGLLAFLIAVPLLALAMYLIYRACLRGHVVAGIHPNIFRNTLIFLNLFALNSIFYCVSPAISSGFLVGTAGILVFISSLLTIARQVVGTWLVAGWLIGILLIVVKFNGLI